MQKEKSVIERELQTLWEKERIRGMALRFEGQGVLGAEGSTCRIKCTSCGHVYVHDFKIYGAFENLLQCQTRQELEFLYGRGTNIFEVKCSRCNASVVIKVFRGKI
jgi:hypothetical protein